MPNLSKFLEQNPNYIFPNTVTWQDLNLNLTQEQFDLQCSQLATRIDQESALLSTQPEVLESLGFNPRISQFFTESSNNLSFMRFGFAVDNTNSPKLIEVNSQTPSFIWECHAGLKDYHKKSSISNTIYTDKLTKWLETQITAATLKINKLMKPNIGIVCCNHPDDYFQMEYLQDIIKSSNLVYDSEVLNIEQIDVTATDRLFSLTTNKYFDILIFWYPIEWLLTDQFANGEQAFEAIWNLVANDKLVIINGLQSFVVQNKNFLAYLHEMHDDLPSLILPSFYTLDEYKAEFGDRDYIAKPIFGREGLGIFGQKNNEIFSGDCSDSYYTDQFYVYQPFLNGNKINLSGEQYTYTLEKWVVKINGIWHSSGQGLRISKSDIIDNVGQWVGLE